MYEKSLSPQSCIRPDIVGRLSQFHGSQFFPFYGGVCMTSDALFPKELLSHPLLASLPPNFFFWRGWVIKSSPTRLPFPKFLFLERLSWREVEDDGLKQVRFEL